MLDQFVRSSNNHNHSTRNVNCNFFVPQVSSQGHDSFKFCAINLWNGIPDFIRKEKTKLSFKFNCKKFLLSEMKKEESNEFVY